jgi:hypothetical protein
MLYGDTLLWVIFVCSNVRICIMSDCCDLCQSLSEWRLLLSECVFMCRREMSELELEYCL